MNEEHDQHEAGSPDARATDRTDARSRAPAPALGITGAGSPPPTTSSSRAPTPAASPLPPGSLDDAGCLRGERPCHRCGFLLTGLRPGGDCPECGYPIARSLVDDLLEHAEPRWLRTVRLGQRLAVWSTLAGWAFGILIGVAVAVVMLRGGIAGTAGLGAIVAAALVVGLAVGGATTLGVWFFTTPDPTVPPGRARRTPRAIARWCILATIPSAFAGAWVQRSTLLTAAGPGGAGGATAAGGGGAPAAAPAAAPGAWPGAAGIAGSPLDLMISVLATLLGAVVLVAWVAALHHGASLWDRVPDAVRSRRLRMCANVLAGSYGVTLLAGLATFFLPQPAPGAMPTQGALAMAGVGCISGLAGLVAIGFGVACLVYAFKLDARMSSALAGR